jgi:hypothetical protein
VEARFAGFIAFLLGHESIDIALGQRAFVLVLFPQQFFLREGCGGYLGESISERWTGGGPKG